MRLNSISHLLARSLILFHVNVLVQELVKININNKENVALVLARASAVNVVKDKVDRTTRPHQQQQHEGQNNNNNNINNEVATCSASSATAPADCRSYTIPPSPFFPGRSPQSTHQHFHLPPDHLTITTPTQHTEDTTSTSPAFFPEKTSPTNYFYSNLRSIQQLHHLLGSPRMQAPFTVKSVGLGWSAPSFPEHSPAAAGGGSILNVSTPAKIQGIVIGGKGVTSTSKQAIPQTPATNSGASVVPATSSTSNSAATMVSEKPRSKSPIGGGAPLITSTTGAAGLLNNPASAAMALASAKSVLQPRVGALATPSSAACQMGISNLLVGKNIHPAPRPQLHTSTSAGAIQTNHVSTSTTSSPKAKMNVSLSPGGSVIQRHPAATVESLLADVVLRNQLSYGRGETTPILKYGTAGFRSKAENLKACLFRMGLLAALRARQTGRATGVMITASHNPVQDNGVKLVDPFGDMLVESFEEIATSLCNCPDETLTEQLRDIINTHGIDVTRPALVFLGSDTRPSSPDLALAAIEGVASMGGNPRYMGTCTTPQLHFYVRSFNNPSYGVPDNFGYRSKYSAAWNRFVSLDENPTKQRYVPHVFVDAANGIGAKTVRLFQLAAQQEDGSSSASDQHSFLSGLSMTLFNQGEGELNKGCGADFVKTKGAPSAGSSGQVGRYAAFDGDADRLIYYILHKDEEQNQLLFALLDGDRIATLYAKFLGEKLAVLGLNDGKLDIGLVQTGYANGASVAHGQTMLKGRKPVIAKTGVKFCHAKAKYMDVGIYFEANGHGTIVFSDKFVSSVSSFIAGGGVVGGFLPGAGEARPAPGATHAQFIAAQQLLAFRDLINEAVGDAFSDMLAVEAVLRLYDWSEHDWLAEYEDLPNRLAKVEVPDRTMVETLPDDETICTAPAGLQESIDHLVTRIPQGRAFVRPSGTEDVIRVYAEAASEADADFLIQKVSDLVKDFCPPPSP
ncbi:unnamed protein product [Amoebophrya sp. A25]|nr:unnamed protein product [Amoebophrya sp. A25]|eukprot:GSA25T00018533001.1